MDKDQTLQAVIFDMDGVLIDSEPFWQQAMIDTLRAVGVDLPREDALENYGMRIDEVVRLLHERQPWDSPPQAEVVEQIVQAVVRMIDAQGQPKPGVGAVLEMFREEGVPIGLATSSPTPIIEAVMRSLGIAAYFDVIHSAEHEPDGKPHPAVYLSTARKLGLDPRACLVFEDSLPGLFSAKAAGMTCIVIPEAPLAQDERLKAADAVLPSLAAFDRALWERMKDRSRSHPA